MRAVFGVYRGKAELNSAVGALETEGFSASSISVLYPDFRGSNGTNGDSPRLAVARDLGGWNCFSVPRVGRVLAAGPITTALKDIQNHERGDGLGDILVGLGIPEYEAQRYEGHIKDGSGLLSVQTESPEGVAKAKHVLEKIGGEDVSST